MAPLSNEEAFARMQQSQAVQNQLEDDPPVIMLYDDDMLNVMQETLLLLEKRVKGGVGSLTALDASSLQSNLHTIQVEMKANEHQPRPQEQPVTNTATVGAAVKNIDIDTPSDEGDPYQGRGGMGQPVGTVNTYVIPGMDEMSPEEYQKTLQESVIQRQRQRRLDGKTTGNKASWDYLNTLTGESGVLKDKNV